MEKRSSSLEPPFEKEGVMATLVTELREQVKERNSQLEAVRGEISSIRDTIQKESKERQNFMSNVIHIDEADKLITDHEQLRESLQVKQTQLKNLHEGSAQEQKELERAREQVEELLNSQLTISCQREQNTLAVEELKRQREMVQETCSETKARLENARMELSRCRENEVRKSKTHVPRKPLSERLDQFIITTCKQAGLEL